MVYTPEEKQRMDALLAAFSGYVRSNRDMDVAYSERSGYVRLITADHADTVYFLIEDFDDMLRMFCYDVVADEVDYALERDPELINRDMDYGVPYRRLRDILGTLDGDREYALAKLEEFIGAWKSHELFP